MSSNPSGLRFSPFTNPQQKAQQQQQSGTKPMASNGNMNNPERALSEARNPLFSPGNSMSKGVAHSNRSSLKESNSNRSSMDAHSSYNTLIIHDDGIYSTESGSSGRKDRPRSGTEQMMKILEASDYNQNSVLKQLVKEMKLPSQADRLSNSSRMQAENDTHRPPPKYGLACEKKKAETAIDDNREEEEDDDDDECGDQEASLSKLKSKSQPDLSRIIDIDLETIEAVMKDNAMMKEQLNHCYKKVARTKKLEEEVANIYRVHEELVQSCERREKLERAARTRLQSEVQRLQELNKALKEEVDVYQSQLLAPSEHQMIIAQLFQQNKELTAAKERQDIEIAAQRATLQEQRKHIGILDKALQNAQHNSRCLEEELRKKQAFVMSQLQPPSSDGLKESNRSGSSTNSVEAKWIADQTKLMSRLDIDCSKLEQRRLDEVAYRQNLAKSIEKTSQESERMLAEAREEKMRYLEEFHMAQKKVSDLQNHLKDLEGHMVEKDALIRALQVPKGCGSSFDSWPLNASNASFNTSMDQNYGPSNHMSSSSSSLLPNSEAAANYHLRSGEVAANFASKIATNSPSSSPSLNNYTNPGLTYGEQQMLLAAHHHRPSYSPKPGSSSGYDNRVADAVDYNMLLNSQERLVTRKSMEDQLMKKEFDAQLNKRGLCCFPNLSSLSKKPSIMPITSNANSSDAFLQKLDKHLQPHQESPSKQADDMFVMLERQGRSSQRMRSEMSSVATTIPRGMINASPTMSTQTDKRGASLPPARNNNLKPPRKNFGFSGSLNRKEDAANKVEFSMQNKPGGDKGGPTFMQQITGGASYQRLSPTKKKSLLPTPSAGRSTRMGPSHASAVVHQYMPIGRSPTPGRHAHFILGRTPTPTPPPPQHQRNISKCQREY